MDLRDCKSMRAVLFAIGCISLIIGVIGVFVPVLPTTPFVLLSAWCFMRSNERFHRWLLHHPRFGPVINDWNLYGAIPASAKAMAGISVSISLAVIWWRVRFPAVKFTVTALLLAVTVFIFSRPRKPSYPAEDISKRARHPSTGDPQTEQKRES